MEVTELAYIAGILDGEGYIAIRRERSSRKYSLYVGVGNTDRELVEWLRDNFKGKLVMSRKPAGYKDFFQWAIVSRSAGSLLKSVLPYLRIKRSRAELALQFQQQKRDSVTGKKRGPRTPGEYAYEIACYDLMKVLNQKGKHEEADTHGNPVPSLSKGKCSRQEGVETRDEKPNQ